MVNDEFQELLADFLLESDERISSVESSLLQVASTAPEDRSASLESIRRDLHTLKGNSGMMGLTDLQALAHRLEDTVGELEPSNPQIDPVLVGLDEFKAGLNELRQPKKSATTTATTAQHKASVRVDTDDLDHLLRLTTELLSVRAYLAELASLGLSLDTTLDDYRERSRDLWRQTEDTRLHLEKILSPLDDGLRRLRMVPLQRLFGSLQRLVHDEGTRAGKQVALLTRGEDTPLDAALVEVAADALGHLVRNAVIHGIEAPDERTAAGKPQQGTVLLEAAVRGRWVEIEVLDDGAGVAREKLVHAAQSRGLDVDPEADINTLIFHSGLSTRQVADRSSGRGVGTAAVLEAVHRYGGSIEVDTRPGVGTRFLLRLPLTVAVTEALLLEADDERYALPIATIVETMETDSSNVLASDNCLFIQRDGLHIPLTDLRQFFQLQKRQDERGFAVLLSQEGRLCALHADQLSNVTTIVVNPLDPALGRPPGIAGSTVLGSGEVVMILDPPTFSLTPLETVA